jgi:hypothetical protein
LCFCCDEDTGNFQVLSDFRLPARPPGGIVHFSKVNGKNDDINDRRWSLMVDIMIGGAIPPVQNNLENRDNSRRQAQKKKGTKDRRKAKVDRRKSSRCGVVVTLSKYPDRRRGPDRRKQSE